MLPHLLSALHPGRLGVYPHVAQLTFRIRASFCSILQSSAALSCCCSLTLHDREAQLNLKMFLSFLVSPYTILLLPVLYYVLPYVRSQAIRDIPSPFPAAFTNLWLLYQCRRGRRYLAVDDAHKKYGTLVRIQPDHVSVADAEAIPIIYGHGNGFLKR